MQIEKILTNDIVDLEKQVQNNDPEEMIKESLNFIVPICKESITEYTSILNKLEAL